MNMRIWTYVCSIVALSFILSTARAGDAANMVLEPLQGEWAMTSCEIGGSPLPDPMIKTGKRIVKGDEITVTVAGMLIMKAKITVDATKNPKTIDYVVSDGNHKGKTVLGIYEVDGDTLKSCFAAPDQPRPDAFESKKDDGRTNSVWKKQVAK